MAVEYFEKYRDLSTVMGDAIAISDAELILVEATSKYEGSNLQACPEKKRKKRRTIYQNCCVKEYGKESPSTILCGLNL